MKRITYIWLAGAVLTGMFVSVSGAQSNSLGDYARAARKESKPAATKKFDNDNLPRTDKLSVVGTPSPESSQAVLNGDGTAVAQASDQSAGTQATAADSGTDKKQASDEWKTKIADQKNKIDLLARELDVAQREYRLRAAAMYADAGNRLRNSGAWDKEDSQYKKQIAEKQKAVDDAKKALEDTQEQARKAGVPASARQ